MTTKLLTLLLILLLTQCDRCKEEVKPIAEIDKLPPATQSGKFTFGCLINGKAFVQKNSGVMNAIYQRGFIQIASGQEIGEISEGVSLVINLPQVNTPYTLPNFAESRARYRKRYTSGPYCYYDYNNTQSGSILLTRLDRQKFIVSGTFAFTTAVAGCDTIRITDGRFDMQYIP